jgi:hypothetical protein
VPSGSPEDGYLNRGRNIFESLNLKSIFYLSTHEEIFRISLPKPKPVEDDLFSFKDPYSSDLEDMKNTRKRLIYPPKASVFTVLDLDQSPSGVPGSEGKALYAVIIAAHKQDVYYTRIPTVGRIVNSALKLQSSSVVDAISIFANTAYVATKDTLYLFSFKNNILKHFRSFSLECIGNPCIRLMSPPTYVQNVKVMLLLAEPGNSIHGLAFYENSVASIPDYSSSLLTIELSMMAE